jgi:rhamnogalacturonan endolyase
MFLPALAILIVLLAPLHAQRQMEALGRGIVAINQGSGRVHVGWRLLGTDPDEIAFNLYRSTGGDAAVRLNATPLTQTTDYVDMGVDTTRTVTYFVRPVLFGEELPPSTVFTLPANAPVRAYLTLPLTPPPNGTAPDGTGYSYTPNDCSAGDLDGDGEYEIIVKWEPTNAKDNSQSGYTGNVFLDGLRLDGTRLWRIDLGRNIRAGAHYTQFMVYDLDGDGRAEVACKTADGTTDGTGHVIGDAAADYRSSAGYILRGPEFLTVFDGLTGAALATTGYVPARNDNPASSDVSAWGDNYGNRVDRFLAGVAYLDGSRPSLVMCRGYYTRTVLVAWDWRDGKLTQRWKFDTRTEANPRSPAAGFSNWEEMGNHQLSVADVDGDGRDEIVYGAMVIDDDGRGLYTTGRGHGDAFHVSDMDPDHPGLEAYGPHENPSLYGDHGSEMREAATGHVIWSASGDNSDVGRGVAFDIDPRTRGYEGWSSRGGLYSAKGVLISNSRPSQMNFGVWWDADPLRELLDGTTISKWDWTANRSNTLLSASGSSSNNSTKATPNLSADILGDWREEVIWRSSDNRELRIYSTAIPATNRLYTLMHDAQYRVAIAWQNTGYNQPPHPGFYLGDGMSRPPTPLIHTTPRPGHLANMSVRTLAGSGDETLVVGFTLGGSGQQTVLVRGIGPTLTDFQVTDAMSDPAIELFAGQSRIGVSNDWSSESAADRLASAADAVGAFPLPRPSRDAALLPNLESGGYSARVSAASGGSGVAMVELYPTSPASSLRLINVSTLAPAGSGSKTLIAGFVVDSSAARTFVIRVVGPSLAQYGVSHPLADPQLAVYRDQNRIAANDDWGRDSGANAASFATVGAFPLPEGSKDAAIVLNLLPGAYAVHASSATGETGTALIEVYEVAD